MTYVAQRAAANFVPHLTLAEQSENSDDESLELFRAFGIEHRLGSHPAELSGGEQARAAFALALARDTPIVVSDEPTAELDRDSAHRLLEAIRTHAAAGTAFILATHDPDVVEVADRVLRLERGRVITGEPPAVKPLRTRRAVETEPVVSVRDAAKSYRLGGETIQALRSASIELGRGEVGAVLGRSGSGKSTLLTLLGGWQLPDSGEIRYALSSPHPRDLLWSELAIMPQRFGLLPELTVRENVEYPAAARGLERPLARRGAARAVRARRARRPAPRRDVDRPAAARRARPCARALTRRGARRRADLPSGRRLARRRLGADPPGRRGGHDLLRRHPRGARRGLREPRVGDRRGRHPAGVSSTTSSASSISTGS